MGKPASNQLKKTLVAAGALILLTVVVYLPVVHCGFVWDDDQNVTNNLTLRSLLGLRLLWTNPLANQQYYPLTHTSFWIEYHLWQLKPLGYHVDNVLLHALSAILLWFILRRLSVPGAWLAAAIFAIHPVNVESVAWITERKNTLSGVFYFAAMLAYLQYAGIGKGRRGTYALALGLFACALLSKTVTSTLPMALLIILWWKRDRVDWREVLELLPLFAMSLFMSQVTASLERSHVGATGQMWNLSLAGKAIIAGKALAFYAGKLFWPLGLMHIYPRWQINPGDAGQYAYPVMAVAIPAALWLLRKRIGKAPLAAVLFFEATLSPALGFFNVYFMKYSFVQDHFQYLASAGLIALGAALLSLAIQRVRGVNAGLPVVILLILGTLASRQIPKFKDAEVLWRDTLAKNPAAWMAHINLAGIELRENRYDEAIAQYEGCLKEVPDCVEAHVGLGVVYARKGDLDRAITYLKQALRISPVDSEANYNYAGILALRGQYDDAIAHYETALRATPDKARTHTTLGMVMLRRGRASDAAEHFMAALKINPAREDAYRGLQLARRQQPLKPKAMDHCIRGIQLEMGGNVQGAIDQYQKAVEINPDFADAYLDLGMAYTKLGQTDDAIGEYQAAIQIEPNMLDAHSNLAVAYYTQGDAASAWEEVKQFRRYGGKANPRFLAALSRLMPEPQ